MLGVKITNIDFLTSNNPESNIIAVIDEIMKDGDAAKELFGSQIIIMHSEKGITDEYFKNDSKIHVGHKLLKLFQCFKGNEEIYSHLYQSIIFINKNFMQLGEVNVEELNWKSKVVNGVMLKMANGDKFLLAAFTFDKIVFDDGSQCRICRSAHEEFLKTIFNPPVFRPYENMILVGYTEGIYIGQRARCHKARYCYNYFEVDRKLHLINRNVPSASHGLIAANCHLWRTLDPCYEEMVYTVNGKQVYLNSISLLCAEVRNF